MHLSVFAVAPRRAATSFTPLAEHFLGRLASYVSVQSRTVPSEGALLQTLKPGTRTLPKLALLDGRGRMLSSEQLAAWIGRERDLGTQQLIFAVGPADGWSAAARSRADLVLSFGPMTFPHELARVMLTEQLYRAFTILAGHPYHTGHASSAG